MYQIVPTHTPVSYTHLRAHETSQDRGCRLLREKGGGGGGGGGTAYEILRCLVGSEMCIRDRYRAKELHHFIFLMVSCHRINFYLPFTNSKKRCFKAGLKSFHIRAKMIRYSFFIFRNENFSNPFITVLKNTSINSKNIGQLCIHFLSPLVIEYYI
ncbi:hypothetical protein ACX3V1_01570 [Escherichia coli]